MHIAFNYKNIFAACVNELDPIVEEIKKEAHSKKYINSFVGTQSDVDEVYKQINAIWKVLQDRGVKYSNYTESVASASLSESKTWIQRVRFINESISNKQVNCVDGSVLMASLFMSIGLDPLLVVKPGHMYLVVKANAVMDKKTKERRDLFIPIETTMIGNEAPLSKAIDAGLNNLKGQVSEIKSLNDVEKYFGIDQRRKKSWHMLIDIRQCRKMGIKPIKTR